MFIDSGGTRLGNADLFHSFLQYRPGIEALLRKLHECRDKTLVVVQDEEKGVIFLGQWNIQLNTMKRLVTFTCNGGEGDIHFRYLEIPNPVDRIVQELHGIISMKIDLARTMIIQERGIEACRMIDDVDRYNEAIRILGSH